MSQEENLEEIRRGHAGFSRGDLSSIRAIVAEDVDWGTTGAFPGLDDSYRGPDGLERWMEAVWSAWESFEVSIDEVVRDADDVLILEERLQGRGRESGVDVEMRIIAVYWFEDGKVVKRRVFDDREDALAAVGLSE